MKNPSLRKVTIEESVSTTPIAERYQRFAEAQGIPVVHGESIANQVHEGQTLAGGKNEVLVSEFRGAAVKKCTGVEEQYICCNLHIMNQTTNCPLDCSYCILQAYINRPVMTVHANVDEMLRQLREQAAKQPERLFRVGTGDLADALALDPIGRVTQELVPQIAEIPNVVLELKTKTAAVSQLLQLEHRGRVVVSWSLNTPTIANTEEHRCASIDERLRAAQRVVEAGYLIAFHFDPMVVYDGWEEEYTDTARRLVEAVPADHVAWVSMGALRFPPRMLKSMRQRFPNSQLPLGELIVAADGKARYLKPLRLALYRTIRQALDFGSDHDVFMYLCMEFPEIWRRVFGLSPASRHELDFLFASNLQARFPHLLPQPAVWRNYDGAASLNSEPEADPQGNATDDRTGRTCENRVQ